MPHPSHLPGVLALVSSLASCVAPPAQPAALLRLGALPDAPVPAQAAGRVPAGMVAAGGLNADGVVRGRVTVPAGMVAAGGLNYALRGAREGGVGAEGVLVFALDAAGRAVPGVPAARTDAAGGYALRGLPRGVALVLRARLATPAGEQRALETFVRLDGPEAVADLDAETTAATAAARQAGTLARMAPAAFAAAVAALRTGPAASPTPAPTASPDTWDAELGRRRVDLQAERDAEEQAAAKARDARKRGG